MPKNIKLYGSIIIIFSTCFALVPTLNGNYIMDDYSFVYSNERTDSIKSIPHYFTNSVFDENTKDSLYRPILMSSIYLNRLLFGHNAYAYHFINLILHVFVSLLLFYLLAFFVGFSVKSLIPALLFAVHPIHIDAVAFIYNRSVIICTLFLLIGLIILLKDKYWLNYFSLKKYEPTHGGTSSKPGILPIILASIAFMLALLSKESGAVAIPLLLLFAVFKSLHEKSFPFTKYNTLLFLILFSVLLFYLLIRFKVLGEAGQFHKIDVFEYRSFCTVFPTISRIFSEYIGLLIVPFPLKIDYSDYEISKSCLDLKAILSYSLHLGIWSSAIYGLSKKNLYVFFILAFYAALLPVSHIIPFFGLKAERFLYIPSIFFCVFFSYPLSLYKGNVNRKKILILFYIMLIVFYGSISLKSSLPFLSGKVLFQKMVKLAPNNAKFRFGLGDYLIFSGENEKGIEQFKKAIELEKRYSKVYSALAIAYYRNGQNDLAEETFLHAIENFPDHVTLLRNYAVFKYELNDTEEALLYINKALSIEPQDEALTKIRNMIKAGLKGQTRPKGLKD